MTVQITALSIQLIRCVAMTDILWQNKYSSPEFCIRYDTRCYFNVCSNADISQCNVMCRFIYRGLKSSQMRLTAENKNVFSFAAKVQTLQFNIRSSGGRLFYTRGPATAKFLAPMAVRVHGTYRVLVSVDRSGRRPATDDTRMQSSVR